MELRQTSALADCNSLKRAALLYDGVFPIFVLDDELITADSYKTALSEALHADAKREIIQWTINGSLKGLATSAYGYAYPGNPDLENERIIGGAFVPVFSSPGQLDMYLKHMSAARWNIAPPRRLTENLTERNMFHSRFRRAIFFAAFERIGFVSEKLTTWEEVKEVRADRDALKKYRCLIDVGKDIGTLSGAELADSLSKRVEDYEWALKKHGLKTVNGMLSLALSKEAIIASTLSAAFGAAFGSDLAAALMGGIPLAAGVAINIIDQSIAREDIRRTGQGGEIALLYNEVERLKRHS